MYLSRLNETPDASRDGGKGYNLKVLTQAGFNVPEAVIISAEFYSVHYPQPPQLSFHDEIVLAQQCERFRQKIFEQPLPKELEADIALFIKELGKESRFAVRSSSTFEDLAGAAFAGQHETFLNVSPEKINEKVRLCLSSLWSPHAVLYRNHQGFSQAEASMAVVIQRMIPGEAAGVAFSVDPVSGILKHVLIEGNFGVGESVVGGESITDSWVVDVQSKTIIDRRVHEKEYALVAVHEGLDKKILSDAEKDQPALTDEQIMEVAQTSRQLMGYYEVPQDMEWVYERGKLYLVQARPQTTIPPRFTRDESAERFPEPLTPLTWSYVQAAFNHSLEYSLNLMQISLPTRPWFDLKNGYVYGNQNAVHLLALNKPIKAGTFDELIKEIPRLRTKYQWVKELPVAWMRDLDRYLLRVGKLSHQPMGTFGCDDYKRYFKEIFVVANEYFQPNIAISMTQAFLTRVLLKLISLLVRDELQAHDLLKKIIAVSETKTGQINRELYGLSCMARNNIGLRQLLNGNKKDALQKLDEFPEFASRFRMFLDDYGHREINFDYYHPTWVEAPEVVLDLITLTANMEMKEDLVEKERQLRQQQLQATADLFDRTPKELHFLMQEVIRLTLNFTMLDDLEHFQTTRLNLLARRAVGRFGLVFKEKGELDDPYDLFFLTREEIEQINDFHLPPQLKKMIQERKQAFLKAQKEEPAWSLNEETVKVVDEDPTHLRGIPGSAGECEGKVYLVRGVEDFSGMPEGAILVARTTNPAWTPLFYKAKGVITESGGPLSHGAITARELGLPAVMSVRQCLNRLKNGDKVRINGSQGMVQII